MHFDLHKGGNYVGAAELTVNINTYIKHYIL